ncbi:MAG: hypothetical protein Q7S51_09560 [Gallionellaceae bacterium]|nr:hypothetical protein [Gallionellaceae bacterium]
MINAADYFHTEWAAMSLHDWIGTIITVTVFILMIGAYVVVLDPKRKNELEAQRHIPLDEGRLEKGEK